MSAFNLLSEEHKEALVEIAQGLIVYADYCNIYEDSEWADESEELQKQAHHYLTTRIKAVRVGR